jgi:hypothetical protein
LRRRVHFIPAWIEIDENDPFHRLVLDITPNVEAPDELLGAVIEALHSRMCHTM